MPKPILFAWVGDSDLNAPSRTMKTGIGPIANAITKREFDRLILLSNYENDPRVAAYVSWLAQFNFSKEKIDLIPVALKSVISFGEIYEKTETVVSNALRKFRIEVMPIFHLSPGTPTMAAVWILLAKGRFSKAKLIQTSQQEGLLDVEMPFDISADFVPSLIRGADERLENLAAHLPNDAPEFAQIIHRSPVMHEVVARARLVACRDVPVLIEGETGTGKELFARAIHESSKRKQGPFIAVNCGAIAKDLIEAELFGHRKGAFTGADRERVGYFEAANCGTIFLDELGELPLDAQVKILRVINDREIIRVGETKPKQIDTRVIAATNRNLIEEVAEGTFRSDLFYRLAVAVIKLPPLRDRQGDVSLLIDSMLGHVNDELSGELGYESKIISAKARNLMLEHPWPGNARELFNTIMRICVWTPGKIIDVEDARQALLPNLQNEKAYDLERPIAKGFNLQELLGEIAISYIEKALLESGSKKSKAAELLGFSNYQTLSNWMKRYGIEN